MLRYIFFGKPCGFCTDLALLVLRLFFGITMAFAHGLGKIQNFDKYAEKFFDPIGVGPAAALGLAIFAEVFCSLGLVVGLFTRLTVIPLIVTMIVAAFLVHANDAFKVKELALVYLAVYVVLLLAGAGRFSIDGLILKKLEGGKADA